MLSTVILPWLHYVTLLMMAGAAVAELYLLRLPATADTVRLLPRVDLFYGLNAIGVLVTGLLRMYHGGKGADYYWSNGLMHGLLTAYFIAFLISLVPTLRFRRWARSLSVDGSLPTPEGVRKTAPLVHIQLTLIALMALMITLVARGYGGS
jgi:putative membrane protein